MSTFAYMNTYGGPELFLLFVVLIVTPLVYSWWLKRFRRRNRIVVILCVWITAAVAAYGDVYYIARQAERLCRDEAGLHVYRRVIPTGLLGVWEPRKWLTYGFSFIERTEKRQKVRFSLREESLIREPIMEFQSIFEVRSSRHLRSSTIVEQLEAIVDRNNGEALGDITAFLIYPGWMDSKFFGVMGYSFIPKRCDGNYSPERGKRIFRLDNLIKAVFRFENDYMEVLRNAGSEDDL